MALRVMYPIAKETDTSFEFLFGKDPIEKSVQNKDTRKALLKIKNKIHAFQGNREPEQGRLPERTGWRIMTEPAFAVTYRSSKSEDIPEPIRKIQRADETSMGPDSEYKEDEIPLLDDLNIYYLSVPEPVMYFDRCIEIDKRISKSKLPMRLAGTYVHDLLEGGVSKRHYENVRRFKEDYIKIETDYLKALWGDNFSLQIPLDIIQRYYEALWGTVPIQNRFAKEVIFQNELVGLIEAKQIGDNPKQKEPKLTLGKDRRVNLVRQKKLIPDILIYPYDRFTKEFSRTSDVYEDLPVDYLVAAMGALAIEIKTVHVAREPNSIESTANSVASEYANVFYTGRLVVLFVFRPGTKCITFEYDFS